MKKTIEKIIDELIEHVPVFGVAILLYACIRKVLEMPDCDMFSINSIVEGVYINLIFIVLKRAIKRQTTNIMIDNKKVEF